MSEEGGGKLRLKQPRKAPLRLSRSREPSPGREPPARRQTLAHRYSWFEQQGLTESENTWLLMLKAVTPALTHTRSWETVPSLPEFPGQNSENETNPPQPEVFKVGMKDFQWIPFPSFCKEIVLPRNDPSLCHLLESQTEHLMERGDQVDKKQLSIAPVIDKISLAVNEDPAENLRIKNSRKCLKLKEKERTERCKCTQCTDSAQCSVPASTQRCEKDFCLHQLCKGTVLSEEKARKENESEGQQSPPQMHRHNVLLGKTTSSGAEIQSPPVDIPRMEGLEEKAEDRGARTLTLDSCPMCLIQFTETLSQLDIDSHLAKCLSESADDVIW